MADWFGLWFETTTGKLIDVEMPGEGPLDESVTVHRGAGLYPPPRTVHVISLPAHEFRETARRVNALVRIEMPYFDGVRRVALAAVLRRAGFRLDPAQLAELASRDSPSFESDVQEVVALAQRKNVDLRLAEPQDVDRFIPLADEVITRRRKG